MTYDNTLFCCKTLEQTVAYDRYLQTDEFGDVKMYDDEEEYGTTYGPTFNFCPFCGKRLSEK